MHSHSHSVPFQVSSERAPQHLQLGAFLWLHVLGTLFQVRLEELPRVLHEPENDCDDSVESPCHQQTKRDRVPRRGPTAVGIHWRAHKRPAQGITDPHCEGHKLPGHTGG